MSPHTPATRGNRVIRGNRATHGNRTNRHTGQRGFGTTALLAEGRADLRARPFLAAALALAVLGGTVLLGVLSAAETGAARAFDRELTERGARVFILAHAQREAIPAERCEALGAEPLVLAAGGEGPGASGRARALPGAAGTIPWREATPGYARVLWPALAEPARAAGAPGGGHRVESSVAADSPLPGTAVLGHTLAEEWGLVPGARILLDLGPGPGSPGVPASAAAPEVREVAVAAVGPASPRVPGSADTLVLISEGLTAVTDCLVEAVPGAGGLLPVLLQARFGPEYLVSALYEPDPAGGSPQERLAARVSLWAPAAIAPAFGACWFGYLLLRRGEFRLYGVLGLTAGQFLLLRAQDALALVGLPLAAGAALALIALGPAPDPLVLWLMGADLARLALACAIFPPASALALRPRRDSSMLRPD